MEADEKDETSEVAREVAPATEAGPEQRLAEAEAKRDEYLALARYVQAEFENYRKRVDRDRVFWKRESLAAFLRDFLGSFDDFRRALADAEKKQDFATLFQGIRLVYDNLWKTLQQAGVKPVEALGRKLDPAVMEAIAAIPNPAQEANTVLEVYQCGYLLEDTLLRPAKVVVAAAAPAQAEPS